jgi:hypothetical protein
MKDARMRVVENSCVGLWTIPGVERCISLTSVAKTSRICMVSVVETSRMSTVSLFHLFQVSDTGHLHLIRLTPSPETKLFCSDLIYENDILQASPSGSTRSDEMLAQLP